MDFNEALQTIKGVIRHQRAFKELEAVLEKAIESERLINTLDAQIQEREIQVASLTASLTDLEKKVQGKKKMFEAAIQDAKDKGVAEYAETLTVQSEALVGLSKEMGVREAQIALVDITLKAQHIKLDAINKQVAEAEALMDKIAAEKAAMLARFQ